MTSPVTPRARAAAKKAAPRKAAADKNTAATARIVGKKAAAPRKKRASPKCIAASVIRPDERHRLIELAAYYIAERRGFHGGSSEDDWLQAEHEIDAMIAAGKFAD